MRRRESPPAATKPEILMMAYLCIKGTEGLVNQVTILDRFKLGDAIIANVCGVAAQSVRNARLAAKKRKLKPSRGAQEVPTE